MANFNLCKPVKKQSKMNKKKSTKVTNFGIFFMHLSKGCFKNFIHKTDNILHKKAVSKEIYFPIWKGNPS